MAHGRLGLGEERLRRLSRSATDEVRQRIDELRSVDVHLGRKAQRENRLNHGVRDARQRGCHRPPELHDRPQIQIAGVPPAVHRERAHAIRMAGREVHADCGAKRDACDMCLLNPDRSEEAGDLVGVDFGRVRPGGLVTLPGPRKVESDAAEVLCVGRQLERITSVIGGEVRNQQQRLAIPLHVIVDSEPVYVNLRHFRLLI